VYESLPSPYREWVAARAAVLGLPGPDDYLLLLVRLEKKRQDLGAVGRRETASGAAGLSPGRP
jgi:hypothetical protein